VDGWYSNVIKSEEGGAILEGIMEGTGPSKLRVFLWVLAKHFISISDVRHHSLCGGEDSWRHSLIECTMSRCVWALAPETITEHMMCTSTPEAKQWIFTMIDTLKHEIYND
jgi:hypothetical protein